MGKFLAFLVLVLDVTVLAIAFVVVQGLPVAAAQPVSQNFRVLRSISVF